MTGSGFVPGSRSIVPPFTATARSRIHWARDLRIPSRVISARDAAASRAGLGVSRLSFGNGVSTESPNCSARRPASVVAAATETCCPRIARTASSKPLNAPGTRRPGVRSTSSASRGSAARCEPITSGRAARSNINRNRASTAGRTPMSDVANSTDSACLSRKGSTRSQPRTFPTATVRK